MKKRESAFVFVMSRQGSVLMGRKSMKANNSGKWGLFGGHLKKGEDPKKGAMREFIEETGVYPIQLGPHFIIRPKPKRNRVIHAFCWFELNEESLNIKLSDEHSAFRWMQPEEKIGDAKLTTTTEIILGAVMETVAYMKTSNRNYGTDTVFELDINLVGF